jgi:hypothetical protein
MATDETRMGNWFFEGFFKPASSPKADDRHRSPKVQAGHAIKNLRSARLQFFFKRSRRGETNWLEAW